MCSPKLISSKLPGNLFQVALQHCKKAYCSFNEWALPMLSCESWMFVKEKPRKKNDARNCLQRSCFSSVIKHFLFSIWEECYFSWNMLKTFLSSKIADAWLWMKPKLFFREKKANLRKDDNTRMFFKFDMKRITHDPLYHQISYKFWKMFYF